MIFSKKTGVRVVACAHVGTRHDPQPGFAKSIILILLMLKPSQMTWVRVVTCAHPTVLELQLANLAEIRATERSRCAEFRNATPEFQRGLESV